MRSRCPGISRTPMIFRLPPRHADDAAPSFSRSPAACHAPCLADDELVLLPGALVDRLRHMSLIAARLWSASEAASYIYELAGAISSGRLETIDTPDRMPTGYAAHLRRLPASRRRAAALARLPAPARQLGKHSGG